MDTKNLPPNPAEAAADNEEETDCSTEDVEEDTKWTMESVLRRMLFYRRAGIDMEKQHVTLKRMLDSEKLEQQIASLEGEEVSKTDTVPDPEGSLIQPDHKKRKMKRGTSDIDYHNGLSNPTDNHLVFESYNETEIHLEMIFDLSRTNAYRSAILQRKNDIEGRIILDVGCGSGILSMFCAQQGAAMVHAVDNSQIIYDAMSNCFENDFDAKIKFHRVDIDKESLDIPEADVIISEFMGYFLYFEGMLETFVRARDKFLKPGGIVMPNKCSVELVPLGPTGQYKDKVLCWDNVYGFRMPGMKARALRDPIIDTVNLSEIIGSSVTVKELDLSSCKVSDIYIDQEFQLDFKDSTQFCAIAGFFSVTFTTTNNDVILSTAPWETPTHWKQAVFFLPTPIDVTAGEKLSGRIKSQPHPENCRWLVTEIWIGETLYKYEFR